MSEAERLLNIYRDMEKKRLEDLEMIRFLMRKYEDEVRAEHEQALPGWQI